MADKKYSCPCCGKLTLFDTGIFEICPICKWEDDDEQRADHDLESKSNKMSLNQAREAYHKGLQIH